MENTQEARGCHIAFSGHPRECGLCGEGACADALARMFDVIAFVKSSFFFFYYKISVPSDIGLLLLIF